MYSTHSMYKGPLLVLIQVAHLLITASHEVQLASLAMYACAMNDEL